MPVRILGRLVAEANANFACVVVNGKVQVSTFPPSMTHAIHSAARVFLQLFLAASSIQRRYQELYISFEYYGLTALRVSPSVTVIVCTPPHPNIEAIKTAIIRQQEALLAQYSSVNEQAFVLNPVPSSQPSPATADVLEVSSLLTTEVETALQAELAEYVGPAAKVLWTRGYSQWAADGKSHTALPSLITMLSDYIDNPHHKTAFIEKAKTLLNY